ncbi:hypothetical protein B10172_11930 [Campylobacter jejuni]|nr:hypothetical protein B10172_11930 [Campylobacter jejuni]
MKKFNKEIILADEKMMSSRNSPFKDVKTLTEFIEKNYRNNNAKNNYNHWN